MVPHKQLQPGSGTTPGEKAERGEALVSDEERRYSSSLPTTYFVVIST